jgi:hypothetical protein
MTTVCKVEIEETTTSVIEGTTVMEVLIMMDGEEVIVVARTLDGEAVVVIVDPWVSLWPDGTVTVDDTTTNSGATLVGDGVVTGCVSVTGTTVVNVEIVTIGDGAGCDKVTGTTVVEVEDDVK